MAQKVLYNNSGRVSEISLSSSSVDLGNVNNTSDTDKPVSSATQTALNAKISNSIVTTKGDIITATGNATPVRQGVGNNGQIIVADDNLTNGLGYKDPAFRNWVMNGNFDIAQRGTSFTNPATGVYTLDRNKVYPNSDSGTYPTIIHSQQLLTSGDIPNSFYCYRINVDGAGSSLGVNSYYLIHNSIEKGNRYLCGLNKKVTVSFYAKSTIANKKIGVYLYQNYGTGGSPSGTETLTGANWTLTSTWAKYTHTFTTNTLSGKTFGTNNDDIISLVFAFQYGTTYGYLVGDNGVAESFVGSGNIDIAQVALYAGDVAYPFEPVPFDVELLRCMRYYEKSYKYSDPPGTTTGEGAQGFLSAGGNCTIGNYIAHTCNYKVTKRTKATPVIYDYSGNSGKVSLMKYNLIPDPNISATVVSNSFDSFFIYAVATDVAQRGIYYHYVCDADF